MWAAFLSTFEKLNVFEIVRPVTTAVTHLSLGEMLNDPTRLSGIGAGAGCAGTGGALGSGLKNTFRLRPKLACFGSLVVTVANFVTSPWYPAVCSTARVILPSLPGG